MPLVAAAAAAAALPSAAAAAGGAVPAMSFGPTANLPAAGNQTVELVSVTGRAQWAELRGYVTRSRGALHLRGPMVFGLMTDAQQEELADGSRALGLGVSIEAGGGLCKDKKGGAATARGMLNNLAAFLGRGGALRFWGLESVFSLTHKACPEQAVSETVDQVAEYAGAVAAALPGVQLFLYDALSHFAVGSWPANVPPTNPGYTGLDLIDTLGMLRNAMAQHNATLQGYWADCPYECSAVYPTNGSMDGYARLAAAVRGVKGVGLEFGKTFNSHEGGADPDASFYNFTLRDYERAAAVVPSPASGGAGFDHVMVETWYPYPAHVLPETAQYTSAYTALAVMHEVAGARMTKL